MAGVIKSEKYLGMVQHLGPFQMQDIEQEAAEILEAARAQASSIRHQATAEGKQVKIRAHEEGVGEGRAEGLAEGRKAGYEAGRAEALRTFREQQRTLIDAMSAALRTFDKDRERYLKQVESDLVDLMLAVTRRVVKRIGMIDRNVAIENLKEAVGLVGRRNRLVVKMHPADLESTDRFAQELREAEHGWEHVSMLGDENIAPGGCVLVVGQGEVDATLDGQLNQLARLLTGGGPETP